MYFAKSIFVIFGLMLFCLCSKAQSDIDFSKLEKSIKNRDEDGVILNYENICQQVPDSSLNSLDFDRFLKFSHELSRLGYADIVALNIDKLERNAYIISNFSPEKKVS